MTTLQERPVQSSGLSMGTGTKVAVFLTRVSIGFTFLWAFLDKTFGLGKSTPSERSWLNGGSPTTGYLKSLLGSEANNFEDKRALADSFQSLAGHAWVDWLFMLGLLGIGLALILGVGSRIAAVSGALLLGFMWLAALPLATNPFMDDHLIYAFVLFVLAGIKADEIAGLGAVWRRIPIVEKTSILH